MINKNSKILVIIFLFVAFVAVTGYFVFVKKEFKDTTASIQSSENNSQESNGFRTFTFDNFHGSTDISDKFQFQYPANWFSDGQYFSPQKIQYYNKFNVKAPVYFDLVLAEIFHLTELQYQIDNSKRIEPDSTGQVDGREFKRYYLADYGSYGGDSAGRVKIFVGPKIKIDGIDYYLVFHWEEMPLAEYLPGNSIEVFDNIILSFKFLR